MLQLELGELCGKGNFGATEHRNRGGTTRSSNSAAGSFRCELPDRSQLLALQQPTAGHCCKPHSAAIAAARALDVPSLTGACLSPS